MGPMVVVSRRLYIPCRTEFVWWNLGHRFDSRGVYGRWQNFDWLAFIGSCVVRAQAIVTVSFMNESGCDNSTCFIGKRLLRGRAATREAPRESDAKCFTCSRTEAVGWCLWLECNGFGKSARTHTRTIQLYLLSPVARFCLCLIDSQRLLLLLLLLANRLLQETVFFFFWSKGWEQMKWWDSCNFWMTPSWQRQCPSIVLSHYALLLCQGAFCVFCWFLCSTLRLQVRL